MQIRFEAGLGQVLHPSCTPPAPPLHPSCRSHAGVHGGGALTRVTRLHSRTHARTRARAHLHTLAHTHHNQLWYVRERRSFLRNLDPLPRLRTPHQKLSPPDPAPPAACRTLCSNSPVVACSRLKVAPRPSPPSPPDRRNVRPFLPLPSTPRLTSSPSAALPAKRRQGL